MVICINVNFVITKLALQNFVITNFVHLYKLGHVEKQYVFDVENLARIWHEFQCHGQVISELQRSTLCSSSTPNKLNLVHLLHPSFKTPGSELGAL